MEEKIYGLLETLVRFDTSNPPGNESSASEYLYGYLKGYANKIELVGHENRKNIIAYFGDLNSDKVLAFNGHLDTALAEGEWSRDPFGLTKEEDLCYGLGSADMKGGVIASIFAILKAKELGYLKDKLVIFIGSADEETGADSVFGCKMAIEHIINSGIKIDAAIIPEPCSDKGKVKINLGHRGLIWLECRTHGTVSHSGLLGKEDNAVLKMMDFVKEAYMLFPKEPKKIDGIPQSSCKVTYIKGGFENSYKKVPGECIAGVDIRISPIENNEDYLRKVSELARKMDVSIKVVKNTPASSISREEKIVRDLEKACSKRGIQYELSYATPTCDAHWFIKNGIPAINGTGPYGENAHASNEFVSLSSIIDRVELYCELIRFF